MTRKFNSRVVCEYCGKHTTAESAFERWMRNNDSLDSAAGIVRFDLDVLLHKYLTLTDKAGDREIQCMMFIEVKTNGATVSKAQQDTLSMFSQVMLNRKRNMHRPKRGLHALDTSAPTAVKSQMIGRPVRLRLYGGHLLRMSGTDPINSEWMEWDRWKRISVVELEQLLRFELDPHSLKPMDWRRRYSSFDHQGLLAFSSATG